jgi:hypothetical protein
MGAMGTIAFHTFFQAVQFPPTHVAQLALAHYHPRSKPASFTKALIILDQETQTKHY